MKRLFAAVLASLLLAAGVADALEQKASYRILVIGDVLAAGLGAGLTRVIADQPGRFAVEMRFKEDSGLARPEIYDWEAALPKILEANQFDIAAVMIGANDVQVIREAGVSLPFDSADWKAAYSARVDRLIAPLKSAGIAIYWVGLPPMTPESYDQSIRAIAGLQQQRAGARGSRIVDTRTAFGGAGGRFIENGPDESGIIRRLRNRDGIRFMKSGNTVLARLVLSAIEQDLTGAGPPVGEAVPEAKVSKGPAFGQAAPVGTGNVLHPDAPTAAELLAANADNSDDDGVKPASLPAEPRPAPQPGSSAESLFKSGLWPAPVKGRFDDVRALP